MWDTWWECDPVSGSRSCFCSVACSWPRFCRSFSRSRATPASPFAKCERRPRARSAEPSPDRSPKRAPGGQTTISGRSSAPRSVPPAWTPSSYSISKDDPPRELGTFASSIPSDRIDPRREAIHHLTTVHGRALAVVVPDAQGAVVAILRTDEESSRVEPLVRLSGLYMGLVALGLLVVSYFALTRFIVAPLDALSRAAQRVATGARRLEVPPSGARELVELGASLRTMTERLISEEEALRNKVAEVERTTTSLREAQDHLVRSEQLASVGRLAAGLAHEVGNPIAAIMGMQDLLLEGGLDEAETRIFWFGCAAKPSASTRS